MSTTPTVAYTVDWMFRHEVEHLSPSDQPTPNGSQGRGAAYDQEKQVKCRIRGYPAQICTITIDGIPYKPGDQLQLPIREALGLCGFGAVDLISMEAPHVKAGDSKETIQWQISKVMCMVQAMREQQKEQQSQQEKQGNNPTWQCLKQQQWSGDESADYK